MNTRKKLPLSVSTFAKLINNNYIYVDKTQYIYSLLDQGGAFFLSRPRRFGKSLLISILKEIFQGNRELFKDCWIYDRIQWDKYPVIHLDFLRVDHKKLGLENALSNVLQKIAVEHDIHLQGNSNAELFDDLIDKLSQKKPVVILIDEYDKPITDNLGNIAEAEKNRDILKNVYSVLKAQERNIHFLFMTGVSRFSPLSVFSDLNHLIDISFEETFVPLLGYTIEEIETYFPDYIQECVDTFPDYSREELFKQLKDFYNGYSWDGKTFVYNPFSILNFFYQKKFKSFWFTTGTPTFLAHMARTRNIDIRTWDKLQVNEQFFDKFDVSNISINLLLFQTGYLTIKKQVDDIYYLSYPNREVENAFLYNLMEEFTGQNNELSTSLSFTIKESLEQKDIASFIEQMKSFLAGIPYPLVTGDVEKYYHLVFYLVLKLAMKKINSEHFSNRGRMDTMVETEHYIYIMEFKMSSAQKALEQIQNKGYYEQYLNQKKAIILLGISFDPEKRNIAEYLHSQIPAH